MINGSAGSAAEWVIAFAGSGETTLANATALLDHWITDDMKVRDFIVPAKITKTQPGLENVVGYLTQTYDGFETLPLPEFIDTLVNAKAGGLQVWLVVIIGDDPPDDVTADLVEAAFEAGITVKDLAAGFDDLVSSAEEAGQAPAEPERPAETTGRRRRTRATPPEAEPAEAATAPSEGTRRRRGQPRATAPAAEGPPWEPDVSESETEIGHQVDEAIASETRHARTDRAGPADLQALITAEINAALVTALSGAVAALTGQAAHAQAPVTAYIKDADGRLHKRGKGKPRRGEEVVFLTRREEREQGLIDSEA